MASWVDLELRVATASQRGDHAGAAKALFEMGVMARDNGDHATARDRYAAAAREFAWSGQARNVVAAFNCAGLSCAALGEWNQGMANFAEAMNVASGLKDPGAMRTTLTNVGALCSQADDPMMAMQYQVYSSTLAVQIGDNAGAASSLYNAAWACVQLLRFDQAQVLLGQAGAMLEGSRKRELMGIVALLQGRLDLRAGRLERSRAELGWAHAVLAEVGSPEWIAHALIAQAMFDEVTGAASPVTERIRAALSGINSTSGWHVNAKRLLGLAHLSRLSQRSGAAVEYAGLATECAQRSRDPNLAAAAAAVRAGLAHGIPISDEAAAAATRAALEFRPPADEPPMPPPPSWTWLPVG